MTGSGPIARICADLRQMGGVGWLFYAIDRALERTSRGKIRLWAFKFLSQPVPAAPMLAPARGAMTIREIGTADLDHDLFERPAGAVEERFASGSRCIAACDQDRLAGYMWLHRGALRERLVACDFEALPNDRAWWDYDFEVMPKYRLGRTFARLWDVAFALMREHGVAHSVSWILWSNMASVRAHERMGARRVGWLVLLDAFDLKIGLQSSAPWVRLAGPGRRLHVGIRADDYSLARNQTPEPERG